MHIPKRVWKIVIGIILVPVLLVGGCAARVWVQDTAAKRFCESLIQKIEKDRAQSGHYPHEANPAWWASQRVPALIRTDRFYTANDTDFRLRFQNDLEFYDNVWEYDSASKTWSNYDANPQRD